TGFFNRSYSLGNTSRIELGDCGPTLERGRWRPRMTSSHDPPGGARMKRFLAIVFVSSIGSCTVAGGLPRSSPEAPGVESSGVLPFVEAADKSIENMNSFMLLRHGQVVAEGWWAPYEATSNHSLYSLSKSFTSTAVGLAIAEGKLSPDDEVLKFFPEH